MPVCVSTEVMRASDKWTIENLVPSKELMARAGKAIFEQVEWQAPVGIICGKGNNAGDGFVVASLLISMTSVSKKASGPFLRAITALTGPFSTVYSVRALGVRSKNRQDLPLRRSIRQALT